MIAITSKGQRAGKTFDMVFQFKNDSDAILVVLHDEERKRIVFENRFDSEKQKRILTFDELDSPKTRSLATRKLLIDNFDHWLISQLSRRLCLRPEFGVYLTVTNAKLETAPCEKCGKKGPHQCVYGGS